MVSVGKEYRQTLFSAQYVKHGFTRGGGVRGDLSRVADGFNCMRCDRTIQGGDLAEDLMVDGETYECVVFVIWETLLMEMVERILLLQLESEIDG